MLKILILLLAPLVVFAISENSIRGTVKPKKQKDKSETPKPDTKDAPSTTQLELFLDDEDFDIVDLINADRRNK